ncbi:MAG: helix-turn-helix domain-containing protein [Bryobacteraceae bacterium]|jgi:transposase
MPTSPAIAAALRERLRQTADSRFWLRLVTNLLVSEGFSYEDAARVMGASARSARRWWKAYKNSGDNGLLEKPPAGRPPRLTPNQTDAIGAVIQKRPRDVGLKGDTWTGKTLAEWLRREFSTSMTDRRGRQILTLLRNE